MRLGYESFRETDPDRFKKNAPRELYRVCTGYVRRDEEKSES
jgi:hypothetical protein